MIRHPLKRTAALLLAALMLFAALPAFAEEAYDLSVTPGLSDEWLNLLLIGTDTRKDVLDEGRADTIIICSVNRETVELKLTSLARDMWVQFPHSGNHGKINAAYQYGGADLLMKTINQTFSMNLENYIVINFYGLIDIVDSLGGVEIEISAAEAGQINRRMTEQFKHEEWSAVGAGTKLLDGRQALCYSRIRNVGDGDFGRTARQRKLLSAMLGKVKQAGPLELMRFGTTCLSHTSTNLGADTVLELGMSLLTGGLDGFTELSLPSPGNYRHATWDGISRVEYDARQVTEELHQFIYGE